MGADPRGGKDGLTGDPAAHTKGHRLIAEWLSNGRRLRVEPQAVTVCEVVTAYLKHAESYYRRPDGRPSTKTLDNQRLALTTVNQLYGVVRAVEFGPLALRACRDHWKSKGLGRTSINMRVAVVTPALLQAAGLAFAVAGQPLRPSRCLVYTVNTQSPIPIPDQAVKA